MPSPLQNIYNASYFKVSYEGIADAIPYTVFSFMYQQSVPKLQSELESNTYENMNIVIIGGSSITVSLYILVSTFGYLTLVSNEFKLNILRTEQNILEVDYESIWFTIGIIMMIISII